MSELSRETKELLARGRGGAPLPRKQREALKGAVLAKIATAAVVSTSATAAAWTATAKVVGLAAVAAVVSATTFGVVRHQEHSRAAAAKSAPATPGIAQTASPPLPEAPVPETSAAILAPSLAPVVAPVSVDQPLPAARPRPATASRASRPPDVPSPAVNAPAEPSIGQGGADPSTGPVTSGAIPPVAPVPSSSLEEEAALLRDANAALALGDAARALRLLDEHQARFSTSALEPERSAERVFALCAKKQGDAARDAANRFLSAHPVGPLAARVRASCGADGARR